MLVRCIKNYEPGFFGFDHRNTYEIGQIYAMYTIHVSTYVFAKEDWRKIYTTDFNKMFVPVIPSLV